MPKVPKSIVENIVWPALLGPQDSILLATMYQLQQTQWWSPEELQQQQFQQIHQLLCHAFRTTAFYRERLGRIGFDSRNRVDSAFFSTIPILHREDIQSHLRRMISSNVPKSHGRQGSLESSGSTGKPVRVHSTYLSHLFWQAFTLRDHFWHNRDFSRKHANIRVGAPSRTAQRWGSATKMFHTGPSLSLDIKVSMDEQIKWVRENAPYYLLSYPSNLREMARRCLETRTTFPALGEIRTFGETVTDDIRDICRQAWGVDIKDMYSAMEIGYLALQCPECEDYHVMAEDVLVEILDNQGRPCRPGEIGRVVITDLHNFATPLIRYDILDYAEVGELCPCGRGLPVLKRIMGRQRNMMKMPDGSMKWPSFSPRKWPGAERIRQLQIIQKEIDLFYIRLEVDTELSAAEEKEIADIIQQRAGFSLRVEFEYTAAIPPAKNYKFDFFKSEA